MCESKEDLWPVIVLSEASKEAEIKLNALDDLNVLVEQLYTPFPV